MKEFKYEIKKHIATVSKSNDGKIALEVNLMSYNEILQLKKSFPEEYERLNGRGGKYAKRFFSCI